MKIGKQMGLDGKELLDYCTEQQKIEHEERAAEREEQKAKREAEELKAKREAEEQKAKREAEEQKAKREAEDRAAERLTAEQKAKREAEERERAEERLAAEKKAKREAEERERAEERRFKLEQERMKYEHELALEKTKQENSTAAINNASINTKAPQLPLFDDNRDKMDVYLERFERFAAIQKWKQESWAVILSALLSGQALEAYARLSAEEATDYTKVKMALLKQYNLTEEGFRRRFRDSKPDENETPSQFLTRISTYFDRWTERADTTSYDALRQLIIREQFLTACPNRLAIYLKERQYIDIDTMCNEADRYLEARGQTLRISTKDDSDSNARQENQMVQQRQHRQCTNCSRLGHTVEQCRHKGGGKEQLCSRCNIYGHLVDTCRHASEFGGMMRIRNYPKKDTYQRTISSNMNINMSNTKKPGVTSNQMKTAQGKINGQVVNVLRDSGCSTVCVNKDLVSQRQFTGKYKHCTLMDGTVRKFQTAVVNVDTPYIKKDKITVLCIENPEVDVVVGEVPGAKCSCSPDPHWSLPLLT